MRERRAAAGRHILTDGNRWGERTVEHTTWWGENKKIKIKKPPVSVGVESTAWNPTQCGRATHQRAAREFSPLKYDEGWWSSRYRIFHISLVKREVNFQPDEKRRAGGCLGPRKWQSRGEKKLEIHLEFQQRQHPGKWRRWEVGGASAQRLLFQSASVIDGQRSGRHTRGRRRDEIEGDDNNCSSKLTLIVGRPFRRPSDASVALCAPWLLRRGAAGHGASGSTWTRWPNWFPPPRTTPGWPTACYYRWPALRPSSSSV